jgi:hypothetical protein
MSRMSLGCILNDSVTGVAGNSLDCIDVNGLTIEVNCDDGSGPGCDRIFNVQLAFR